MCCRRGLGSNEQLQLRVQREGAINQRAGEWCQRAQAAERGSMLKGRALNGRQNLRDVARRQWWLR